MVSGGRIGRPHGLDGSFHVTRPGPALAADVLEVDGVARTVARRAGTPERPILRLDGVGSRAAVLALRGTELLGPPPPLGEDEFLAADLEGCVVVDGDRELGTVRAMRGLPSCEALEVGDDLLVPMVSDAIRSIDVAAKRIEVDARFLGLGPAEGA